MPRVAVVGAGPAGLAAAVAAQEAGASVVLLDQNPAPGGQIWRASGSNLHPEARPWVEKLKAERLFSASAFDRLPDGTLLAETPDGVRRVAADRVILATGARERFLPFPGWTLPNVAGVGGLQALAKGGLPLKGRRVVVAGSGPLLLAVGQHLLEDGADVVAVAEQAPRSVVLRFGFGLLGAPGKLRQAFGFAAAGRKTRFGWWVTKALGENRVQAVDLTDGRRTERVECDYLACAFGLVPNNELPSLLGCRIDLGEVWTDARQQTSVENLFCAGEPTGIGGVDAAIVEGKIAGYAAAGAGERADALLPEKRKHDRFAARLDEAFALRAELRGLAADDTLVCRCEDVRFGDLKAYRGARDAKLHTRCGMGPCQGRICGPATQFLFGWEPGTVRPPVDPVSIASLSEGYGETRLGG